MQPAAPPLSTPKRRFRLVLGALVGTIITLALAAAVAGRGRVPVQHLEQFSDAAGRRRP